VKIVLRENDDYTNWNRVDLNCCNKIYFLISIKSLKINITRVTHSTKCFNHFVSSLTAINSIIFSVYFIDRMSLEGTFIPVCEHYRKEETMVMCAHWKRRWRRENVVNLLDVRLVSNSRFGASRLLSVCASWNNIINICIKKSLRWKRVYTLQCCHLPMRSWWVCLWTIVGFFLFRFLAICGKGESALCGGHVTASSRMHVSWCSAQSDRERRQTRIWAPDRRRTECRGGYYVPIYTKDRE